MKGRPLYIVVASAWVSRYWFAAKLRRNGYYYPVEESYSTTRRAVESWVRAQRKRKGRKP